MLDLIELPETFSCMTGEWFFLQAGKLIANLIVLGSGVLLRAVSQAYRQAIVSESLSLSLSLCLSLSVPLTFSTMFFPLFSAQQYPEVLPANLWRSMKSSWRQVCSNLPIFWVLFWLHSHRLHLSHFMFQR